MNFNFIQNLITLTVTAALIGLTSASARAFSLKSSLESGVFDETTTVNFELIETRGMNQSNFGVLDVDANQFSSLFEETKRWDADPLPEGQEAIDWLGTCGDTIINCSTSFSFEANKAYQIGFWDGDSLFSAFKAIEDSYTYATTAETYSGEPEYKTVSDYGIVFLGMEETPVAETSLRINDYQDFVIKTSVDRKTIPEPASLLGLGVVAASLAICRRHKVKKSSLD